MITFFAYARKSTESDERQIQSIADQIKWISEKTNNEPFKLYTESKSAKDPGVRTEFEKMMKDIQKSNGETCIVCWKLDRLSRNPVDSGLIQYLMQRGKLHKIITNDREYFPVDSGLLMSVENAMSNQFILDIVKNVERGMKFKVEAGGCIQKAPLGYINNKKTKEVEVDPKTAPFVKDIFSLRASGFSLNEIASIIGKKGIKGKNGGELCKSTIDKILKNPFYIGLQKFKGELHKSLHKKLVDVKTWERVNGIKRSYNTYNSEIEFPLKGIIKNYHTKKPLLASFKKKKYIYYSTHSREEFIINMNQNHIVEAFDKIIHQYNLPKEYKPLILKDIRDVLDNYYSELIDKKKILKSKIKDIDKKSKRLFDLVLKGTIDDEKYKEESNQLKIDQKNIEDELKGLNNLDLILIEEAKDLVELLINIDTKRKTLDNDGKIKLLKIIVVELFVDTKKQLFIQENELFEYIKVLNGCDWYSQGELNPCLDRERVPS